MIDLAECPICGGPASGLVGVFESDVSIKNTPFPSRIVRCGCGHHFLNPQPTWKEVEPFYDAEYFDSSNTGKYRGSGAPPVVAGRYNHVPVEPGKRYLDIGCGSGELVAAMARLGMEAEGVEPSLEAVEVARRAGLKVHCGMLHDANYVASSFDTLSMFHVLEHVPKPGEVLGECRRILKPGGMLVIGVPNFDSLTFAIVKRYWIGLQLPTHFHHFTATSLADAAARAGLEVAESKTESSTAQVEHELVNWLRQAAFVPKRLTMMTHVTRPFAARLARKACMSGRGESIVAHLRRKD
jgi:2-polyprenyl-3-methyl-5-hydroxy-6-metoxy-1,4-benzoquinol methylase